MIAAAGIQYANARGERADFHAMRHTFITWLSESGANVKDMMSLARHTDARLTVGKYSHSRIGGLSELGAKLPSFQSEPLAAIATGTDGAYQNAGAERVANRVAPPFREGHIVSGIVVGGNSGDTHSDALVTGYAGECQGVPVLQKKAGEGSRTLNVRLGKPALCH